MKKIFLLLASVAMFTSCYNSRIVVGNMDSKGPMVEVNERWNDHFLYGLVAGRNATMDANECVKNAPAYMVKTSTSFVNGLVSAITFGIYTPTQTKYYLPVDLEQKK